MDRRTVQPGHPRERPVRAEQEARGGPGAGPPAVAQLRDRGRPPARDHRHLRRDDAPDSHRPSVQQSLQRPRPPAMRGLPSRHPLCLPPSTRPPFPLSLLEHGLENATVRIPPAYVPRGDRSSRQD